jgi:hypothetical protein
MDPLARPAGEGYSRSGPVGPGTVKKNREKKIRV